MAEIENKSVQKWPARLSGLLMAVMLYLVYLALSLTDIWGYFPPLFHAAAYGLLFMAMMLVIARGLMLNSIWPLKPSLKAAILSVTTLAIAAILAGPDSKRLLEIAVKPRAIFTTVSAEIIMNVSPPDYSGGKKYTERLTIGDDPKSGIKPIPEGSIITVTVRHMSYAPTLIYGPRKIKFQAAEPSAFMAKFTVGTETAWQIKDGSRQIGSWPLLILADESPTIERAEFRDLNTENGLFGLSLTLSDDFGLKGVWASVRPVGTDDISDRTETTLTGLKNFSGDIYMNLAASEYAGQSVDLLLEAQDQAGQKQTNIIPGIILPDMQFTNPSARQIIEIREDILRYPDQKKKLARRLMALGLLPDDGQKPAVYYMALRSIYWRLTDQKADEDNTDTRQMMWDLAITLEDGDRGAFNREILALLGQLRMSLQQAVILEKIKKQLQEIDKNIILFQRSHKLPDNQEPLDIPSLRKIYGKILTHRHNNRREQAIRLVSYLEHGFIYPRRNILTRQKHEQFLAISHARDSVNKMENSQRKIMAFVYGHVVNVQLASTDNAGGLKNTDLNEMGDWIEKQQKLGEDISDLGRKLLMAGIDAAHLTVAASDLARDVARNMEIGDMEASASYQSQILTLFKSLKKRLGQEMQFRPDSL